MFLALILLKAKMSFVSDSTSEKTLSERLSLGVFGSDHFKISINLSTIFLLPSQLRWTGPSRWFPRSEMSTNVKFFLRHSSLTSMLISLALTLHSRILVSGIDEIRMSLVPV